MVSLGHNEFKQRWCGQAFSWTSSLEYCLHSTATQRVNSFPPYVWKLHFLYEVVLTTRKCHWSIYHTSSKWRWSIYCTSRKRRGTLRVIHKVEQNSPIVRKALTHRGWDKMAAISQMTFSNVFSWIKMFEFRLRFHWSLFLRVQLTIFQLWCR